MNYKTTKKDFEYFRERCVYWAKKLVPEYDIEIFHEDPPIEDCAAACGFLKGNGYATITLNPRLGRKFTKKEYNQVAFHEVMHLVMSSMHLKMAEFYSAEYTDELVHEVIRKMEKLI